MGRGRKIRRISVMEIQRLPAEKVVELFERFNEHKIMLISIYHDRWAQIGLKSPILDDFINKYQAFQQGKMKIMMKKISRRWHNEESKDLPETKKQMDKGKISLAAPPGFHGKKMLRKNLRRT